MGPSSSNQLLITVNKFGGVTDYCSPNSGPEGIRTPDLLSAIEARSQLRYRPKFKAKRILPEAFGNVNEKYGKKITNTESNSGYPVYR